MERRGRRGRKVKYWVKKVGKRHLFYRFSNKSPRWKAGEARGQPAIITPRLLSTEPRTGPIKKFCLRRAAIGTVAGNVLISDKQRHFFPRPFRAPVSPRCAGFCRPLDDLLPVIIACRSNGENIKLSANTDIPTPLFPSKKILTQMLFV